VKICLLTNLFPPVVQGGAEIYVGRLAKALAEHHQVVVVTSEPGFHPAPRREVTPDGIVVYHLAPLNIAHLTRLPHRLLAQAAFRAIDLYHPQVAATLSKILQREQPDLVHIHNWVGLSLAAIMASLNAGRPGGIPAAMTIHDYSLCCVYADLHHPDGHGCGPDLPCRIMTPLNRHLTRSIGLAICASSFSLDVHVRHGFFRHADHQVLPYVTDPSRSAQSPTPQAGRGSKSTFDILYMGRVQTYKGPQVLIRAFRRLPDPTLRLHIAGTGPDAEACQALADGDARIRLYGFVGGDAREALLNSADCMVLPSLWPELFGGSLEAFQAGAVVIASRVGGIPEVVRDGVNGLLVKPGDEVGLAAAIERLRQSPELGVKLRASALETARLYDMRFHVAHLIDAYQRLLVTDRIRPFDQRAA
jgi:glycosyltransferase involved in cell wall biosynthesis